MTTIDKDTGAYGIIGHPIGHTLSPMLHNVVFKSNSINAVYLPFDIKPENLCEALEAFRILNIKGVNITLPHKEKAAAYVDTIPELTDRSIGAINTIVYKDGESFGYNTDGIGFIADLNKVFNFSPKGKRVVVIGAGGAARAVIFYLLKEQAGEIILYNRTFDRAKGLAEYLKGFFSEAKIKAMLSIEELNGAEIDLLVNASSCGMKENDPMPINPDVLENVEYFYDLIYSPEETKFMREAKRRKIKSSNGIGMLIHQALFAQMLWFPGIDQKKTLETLRKAFKQKCR